uniref:Uncharacterized protein n=1 Tax=Salix viminalis TaxID=40686 RepID=A0A6N2L532_SALVM
MREYFLIAGKACNKYCILEIRGGQRFFAFGYFLERVGAIIIVPVKKRTCNGDKIPDNKTKSRFMLRATGIIARPPKRQNPAVGVKGSLVIDHDDTVRLRQRCQGAVRARQRVFVLPSLQAARAASLGGGIFPLPSRNQFQSPELLYMHFSPLAFV